MSTVGSVGLALLVCCVAFVVNDTITLRESMARQSMAMAEVLASNSTAALSFRQDDIAAELLQSMRNRPEIHSAWLLDSDGELFAAYTTASGFEGSALELTDGYQFTDDGFLEVAVAIEEAGDRLGTMRLRLTTENVRRQVWRHITISGCVLIVSLAIGVLMSLPMQRSITRPILELATTAGKVSRDADNSRRVARSSDDEIGVLFEQFNSMLTHIQQTNGELQQARDEMEQRVDERTFMLSQANEDLKTETNRRSRVIPYQDRRVHTAAAGLDWNIRRQVPFG